MDFAFWLQLKEVAPYDTRMRLVLHIDLNMMMRMMIGSKIQGAIDQIAEPRFSQEKPSAIPPQAKRCLQDDRHRPANVTVRIGRRCRSFFPTAGF